MSTNTEITLILLYFVGMGALYIVSGISLLMSLDWTDEDGYKYPSEDGPELKKRAYEFFAVAPLWPCAMILICTFTTFALSMRLGTDFAVETNAQWKRMKSFIIQ